MKALRLSIAATSRLSTISRHLSASPRSQSLVRKMSSSSSQKHEWLVILPDAEGAIERRMEVRPKHLEGVLKDPNPDFWLFGGAYFSDLPKEGQNPPPIIGSVMLASASSKEEVLEKLKNDIYTKSNVWDWDKVQIYPFKSAVRRGL